MLHAKRGLCTKVCHTAADAVPWAMVTKLEKPLKREILIEDKAYVLTISAEGLKLTLKGHRKGQELAWRVLVNGQAALATALNASVQETR